MHGLIIANTVYSHSSVSVDLKFSANITSRGCAETTQASDNTDTCSTDTLTHLKQEFSAFDVAASEGMVCYCGNDYCNGGGNVGLSAVAMMAIAWAYFIC